MRLLTFFPHFSHRGVPCRLAASIVSIVSFNVTQYAEVYLNLTLDLYHNTLGLTTPCNNHNYQYNVF